MALLYLAIPLTTHAITRVALVIGNSDYTASLLKNPENDADDITEWLTSLGFDVELVKNADKRQMIDSIRAFNAKLRNDGTIGLFFYTGHAVDVNGINYLIPLETNIQEENEPVVLVRKKASSDYTGSRQAPPVRRPDTKVILSRGSRLVVF